jgi:hypothetical protein
MATLLCNYCGRDVKNSGSSLWASVNGATCSASPTNKALSINNYYTKVFLFYIIYLWKKKYMTSISQ